MNFFKNAPSKRKLIRTRHKLSYRYNDGIFVVSGRRPPETLSLHPLQHCLNRIMSQTVAISYSPLKTLFPLSSVQKPAHQYERPDDRLTERR